MNLQIKGLIATWCVLELSIQGSDPRGVSDEKLHTGHDRNAAREGQCRKNKISSVTHDNGIISSVTHSRIETDQSLKITKRLLRAISFHLSLPFDLSSRSRGPRCRANCF